MTDAKAVALVLDPGFGERLDELAVQMPVWVVASAQNSPVVTRLRKNSGTALTLLLTMHGESARDLVRRALANIHEHHGPVSGHRYDKLHLFGLEPHAISSEVLDEFSLDVDPHAAGLVLVSRSRA